MKKIIYIYLLLSYFVIGNAQYLIDQSEPERIKKNNIQKKIEFEYSYKDGKLNPEAFKATETTFDKNGNTLEKIAYRYGGGLSSRLNYEYNDDDLLTMHSRYDGRKNSYTQKKNITYDRSGNKVLEEGISGNSGNFRNYYKYDKNGELIEIIYYTDNIITEKRTIDYFENKREIKIFQGGETLSGKIIKTFDKQENLLQEVRFSTTGNEMQKQVYKYDSKNQMTEESKYYSGNLTEKLNYKYDANGNLIEVTTTKPDGTSFVSNIYKYDSSGRLIEEKWYNEHNKDYSSKQYTYNGKGDLIQAKCYYANFGSSYVYRYEYESF